jgi:hypothetical protein
MSPRFAWVKPEVRLSALVECEHSLQSLSTLVESEHSLQVEGGDEDAGRCISAVRGSTALGLNTLWRSSSTRGFCNGVNRFLECVPHSPGISL